MGASRAPRSWAVGWGLRQGLPGDTAREASFATRKGQEADLETLVSVPVAERKVLGPDAGVQARVPVQVTENRPIGTCTAYPGLLERGHGLRQGLGPPGGACGFLPSEESVGSQPWCPEASITTRITEQSGGRPGVSWVGSFENGLAIAGQALRVRLTVTRY